MPEEKVIKYKFRLDTGYANATHEEVVTVVELGFSNKEWLALTEEKRDEYLESYYNDCMLSAYIDGSWEEVK